MTWKLIKTMNASQKKSSKKLNERVRRKALVKAEATI